MDRSITRFTLILAGSLLVILGLHLLVLHTRNLSLFDNKIILAYLINFIVALGTFIALFRLREKLKNQLGFLFMAASFLKFLFVFSFILPRIF